MNVNVPSRLSTFVDLPEGSAKRRSLGVSWRGYCINDGAVYTLGRDTSDSMAVYGDHHHTVRLLQQNTFNSKASYASRKLDHKVPQVPRKG